MPRARVRTKDMSYLLDRRYRPPHDPTWDTAERSCSGRHTNGRAAECTVRAQSVTARTLRRPLTGGVVKGTMSLAGCAGRRSLRAVKGTHAAGRTRAVSCHRGPVQRVPG